MLWKEILLSLLICLSLLYIVIKWDKKRRKDKKAKVVEMDIEDYDFETYHKN